MVVSGGGRKNRSSRQRVSAGGRATATRLLERALKSLADSLGAHTASIVLADRRTGSLVVRAAYGLSEGARQSRGRLGEGVASYVLSQSKPLLLKDPGSDSRFRRVPLTPRADISSAICVPLSFSRTAAGVLSLSRKMGAPPFRPEDLQLAASMAAQLRPAVENALRRRRPAAAPAGSREAPESRGPRTEENLRRQLREATLLYSAVRRLNASVTLRQVLGELRRGTRQILGNTKVEEKCLVFARALDGSRPARLADVNGSRRASTIRTGRQLASPLWVKQNDSGSELAQAVAGKGKQALLVPLRDGTSAVGVAAILGLSRRPSRQKIAKLSALHAHGAAAVRRAIAYGRASKRQSLGLSGVEDLCRKMSEAGTLKDVLVSLLRVARSIAPYDSALLLVTDEANGQLKVVAARGRRQELGGWESGIYDWVAAQRRAFLADAVAGFGCLMAVPLVAEKRGLGAIALQGKTGAFSQAQVKMLSIVACQAAAAYRALQSLSRLSQYGENLLTSLVAGVIGLDADGRVAVWSPAAEDVLGYPGLLATGQPIDEVMESVARRKGWPAVTMIAHFGLQAVGGRARASSRELACEDASGKVAYLNVSCSPVKNASGEGTGAVILVEDATERKQLEHGMQHVQQLAALGHMAAKVAHEVRNPLSAIKAAAQFLKEDSTDNGLVRQLSDIIDEECDRLRKLTSDFLLYARPSIPKADDVRVEVVARRCARLMGPELKQKGISIACRFPRSLPRVEADAEQLEQVFINLFTNAAQAIDGEGRVVVTGRWGNDSARPVVEISVRDSGPGIPAECLEHIFEPFFTTKTRGTGLGLSIARQIVEAHDGEISVSARPGRGSTFTVRIPVERNGSTAHGGGGYGTRG